MGNQSSTQTWPPSWIKIRHELIPVEDGKTVDQADFRLYLQKADRAPKIFKSLVDPNKLQNWNPEGVSKILGGASVEVYVSTTGNFPGGHGSIYDGKERKKVTMKAKEALERIQHAGSHHPVLAAGERYYIYQYDSKPFTPLIDQIPNSPTAMAPVADVFTNVWISSADSLTPSHYDKADNLLLQLQGRKSFLIWDPSQLTNLSLQPETADQDRQTTINMRDHKSVEAHPNFHNASAYHCVLNPGDVLYMPEGWIHAVYSMDASASVNFWWNQPQEPQPMEIEIYDEIRRPKIAPIPIPFGVALTKRFSTMENDRLFFRDENSPIIPCQACSSKTHEYDKCPYLGHYQYERISGQSCDYSMYELVDPTPVLPSELTPINSSFDSFDPFASTKKYRPINKPLVPLPEGVTLANKFNNRDNVMKSQSNVMTEHIDCQACGSKTHELGDCPYLGYYETIHVMGQACDYAGYRLRDLAESSSNSNTAVAAPTSLISVAPTSQLYTPVNRLAQQIPKGLTLTKEFSSLQTSMSIVSACQACNGQDHGYKDCPYLGHYKYKVVCGQISNYEVYSLKENTQ